MSVTSGSFPYEVVMKKLLILPILFASMLTLAAAEKAEPPKKVEPPAQKKEEAVECKCKCPNCPPNSTLSKNKDDVYRYRRCFKDANKDGVCDNSKKAGQKCDNNCVATTAEDAKKANKKIQLPCANCPCAANCAACVKK